MQPGSTLLSSPSKTVSRSPRLSRAAHRPSKAPQSDPKSQPQIRPAAPVLQNPTLRTIQQCQGVPCSARPTKHVRARRACQELPTGPPGAPNLGHTESQSNVTWTLHPACNTCPHSTLQQRWLITCSQGLPCSARPARHVRARRACPELPTGPPRPPSLTRRQSSWPQRPPPGRKPCGPQGPTYTGICFEHILRLFKAPQSDQAPKLLVSTSSTSTPTQA